MRTVSFFLRTPILGKAAFTGITKMLMKCHADLETVIIRRVSKNDLQSTHKM